MALQGYTKENTMQWSIGTVIKKNSTKTFLCLHHEGAVTINKDVIRCHVIG